MHREDVLTRRWTPRDSTSREVAWRGCIWWMLIDSEGVQVGLLKGWWRSLALVPDKQVKKPPFVRNAALSLARPRFGIIVAKHRRQEHSCAWCGEEKFYHLMRCTNAPKTNMTIVLRHWALRLIHADVSGSGAPGEPKGRRRQAA